MGEAIANFIEIAAVSMFKFAFGSFLGASIGKSFLFTYIANVFGMTLSVFTFSFFGLKIKKLLAHFFPPKDKKKLFTPKNRRLVRIWMKYGLMGIAFLTPPLLTPPVGTLVSSSFGEPRQRIILFMLISSLGWGLLFCYIAFVIKEIPTVKKFFG